MTPVAGLTQDSAGVSGVAESGDAFGDHIAFIPAGAGNSKARLAISAPTEDGTAVNSGGVWVFPVAGAVRRAWVPGAGGVPSGANRFGHAVAGSVD